MRFAPFLAVGACFGLAACATTSGGSTTPSAAETAAPYASTYQAPASGPTLLRGATVFDGLGAELANTDVLIVDGRISAIGQGLSPPQGADVVDASGRFVTPGIIDAHSHLGVYPSPSIQATSDGNEMTGANTAEVWAEHSVWPQDPGFGRAVAGGITTLHILPGSANLFGGRGVTVRPVLNARSVHEMKFPDAPQSLKMACGENPSRVYGSRNQSPATGMGNVAGWRQAFAQAREYNRRVQRAANGDGTAPDRNLRMETLSGVLNGDILVHWHCYRADEMALALAISNEFDFQISAFHHAVEAYKISDLLAANQTCAAMWADWWGFKLEAYDGIRENVPFVHAGGACAIVHSDSDVGIQRLNQEAAKALADGNRVGLSITRAQAWTWLSSNPARALGLAEETGALTPGLRGDVVVWSADPLSSYAVAERVYIDGALIYTRGQGQDRLSDFELGQAYREGAQ